MNRIAIGAVLLLAAPSSASAHTMLEGVGDLYAGLLHPILVPAESLALVAVALLLGQSGRRACRIGLPAVAVGCAAGLALGRHLPPSLATPTLLAVALLAGAVVTAGIRLPRLAACIAAVAGAAIGMDARPDGAALLPALGAGVATVVGALAVAAVVAALALGRDAGWQHVAVRVAASWITASGILYFGWLFTSS